MQLRPELRLSGGTPGGESDAEPAAKSIQTWSLARAAHTHPQTHGASTHSHTAEGRKERLLAPCEGNADETIVHQTSTSRLFTSLRHFLRPLYEPQLKGAPARGASPSIPNLSN